MSNLFDNPWLLLAIGAVLVLIAGIVRQIRPAWGNWPMAVPLIFIITGFALDHFIETDREQIRHLIRECQKGGLEGSINRIEPCIAEDYSDFFHKSKAEILNRIDSAIGSAAITRVDLSRYDLAMNGDKATCELRFRIITDPQNSKYAAGGSYFLVDMEIRFRNYPNDGWKILRTDLKAVNNQSWNWPSVP